MIMTWDGFNSVQIMYGHNPFDSCAIFASLFASDRQLKEIQGAQADLQADAD